MRGEGKKPQIFLKNFQFFPKVFLLDKYGHPQTTSQSFIKFGFFVTKVYGDWTIRDPWWVHVAQTAENRHYTRAISGDRNPTELAGDRTHTTFNS